MQLYNVNCIHFNILIDIFFTLAYLKLNISTHGRIKKSEFGNRSVLHTRPKTKIRIQSPKVRRNNKKDAISEVCWALLLTTYWSCNLLGNMLGFYFHFFYGEKFWALKYFKSKTYFSNPYILQPVNFWCSKLLFLPNLFIAWNIQGLQHQVTMI